MKKKNEKLLVPQCLRNLVPFKKAFTLAEVLITLGIIGVVAALTIPTLVKDYQKKTYVAALKKSHAELTEVFKRIKATENASTIRGSSLYQAILNDEDVYDKFKNHMNIIKYDKDLPYNYLFIDQLTEESNEIIDCTNSNCFQMTNGAIFNISPRSGLQSRKNNLLFNITIDINGEKSPNRFGRDVFNFWMDDNGSLWGVGQNAPCANDLDDHINECLDVALSQWQLTCAWDKYKDFEFKDWMKFSATQSGDMTEEEFDEQWNALTPEEQEAIRIEQEPQIQEGTTMMKLGIGCTGRVLEENAMKY